MDIAKYLPIIISYIISFIAMIFTAGMWFQRDKLSKMHIIKLQKEVSALKTMKPTLEEHNKVTHDLSMVKVQLKEHDEKIEHIQIEEAKIFTKLEYIEKMTDRIDKKLDKIAK